MVLAKNLDADSDEHVPLVLGQDIQTEIFDPSDDVWTPYRPLLRSDWNAITCLVQYGERVYHIENVVFELDLETWNFDILGEKPDFMPRSPGKCAVATIEGTPGMQIMECFI